MRRQSVAATTITRYEGSAFLDEAGNPLNIEGYSRAKYGDSQAAWEYGEAIACAVTSQVDEVLQHDQLVITAPGSVYAPKPALAIARSALAHINTLRVARDKAPGKLLRIFESQMGNPSYANSSQAEREAELAKHTGGHHIPDSLVNNAYVVAVDDCVITGTTEVRQRAIIEEHAPDDILFAYGILVDPEIANKYPQIEHTLNTAYPVTLDLVSELIEQDQFTLNSRVLNFILSSDAEELIPFLDRCPRSQVREIYETAINSTLEYIERHRENIAIVSALMHTAVKQRVA